VITEMSQKLDSMDKDTIRAQTAAAAAEISRRLERWKAMPHMAELMEEEKAMLAEVVA